MPELDRTQTDAIFGDLIAENGLQELTFQATDLRVVPMDYKRVGLNQLEGEELHDALIDVRREVTSFLGSIEADLDDSPLSRELMVNAMEKRIAYSELEGAFGELVAVEGIGWFGVEKPKISATLSNGLLIGSERLFGKLQGLGYGQYQAVSPEAAELYIAERIKPEVTTETGAFIGLTDAIVCRGDLDGLGEVDERHKRVLIPIDISAFRWSRVYPID